MLNDNKKTQDMWRKPTAITAIMMTWGDHVNLSEESLESFLRQTYPNKYLLIVNTHPDPVVLNEKYDNVDVINCDRDFYYLGDKAWFAIENTKTDLWCMMDDDDIYLPWHLEKLMELHSLYPDKDAWCNKQRFASRDNEIKEKKISGLWTGYVFRKKIIPPEILKKKNFDTHIMGFYKNKIAEPTGEIPSYIYRWACGSRHYSGHGGDPVATEKKRKNAANIKLDKPWVPHWDRDYVKDAKEFMRCNYGTI